MVQALPCLDGMRRYQQLHYVFPFLPSCHVSGRRGSSQPAHACSRSVVKMSCHCHGTPCRRLCSAELRCPHAKAAEEDVCVSVSHTPTQYFWC